MRHHKKKYFNRLLNLLSKKRKIELYTVYIFAFFSSIIESFSIGLVVPIMSFILGNKTSIINQYEDNPLVNMIFKSFFNKSPLFLISIFLIFTLISTAIKILNQYLIVKLTAVIIQDIDNQIFKSSIIRPYIEFVKDHSSNTSSAILTKSSALVGSIKGVLEIIISSIGGIFIVISLLIFNWKITILTFIFISLSYFFIGNFFNNKIKIIGKEIAKLESRQVKIVQDSYSNTKNILLGNNFHIYFNIFKNIDKKLRFNRAINSVFTISTRYILEAIIIIIACSIILYSIFKIEKSVEIISYLTILFFGIQKILPYMQSIYNNWINIKVYRRSVEDVLKIINKNASYSNQYLSTKPDEFLFDKFKNITFKNISFKYAKNSELIFNNINLVIQRGAYIGLAGGSGQGKSTLLDILLGLQIPTSGELIVNNKNIFENLFFLKSWQKQISYVSQEINLSSSTLIFNICEETDSQRINLDKVFYCINSAKLDDLVKKLPNGIYSEIGEKGIKLSGGEKQRLLIAKALYKKSNLLILDEATSSLDPVNEKAIIKIIKDIKNKGSNLTVIAVAHRHSTLKDCDSIYYLDSGNLTNISFKDLVKIKK